MSRVITEEIEEAPSPNIKERILSFSKSIKDDKICLGIVTISIFSVCSLILLSTVLYLGTKTYTIIDVDFLGFFPCPARWVGYSDKCFYFSDGMGNWTRGKLFCESVSSTLAKIDDVEELKFVSRYIDFLPHWIGLYRNSSLEEWTWTDGSFKHGLLTVSGEGDRSYVNKHGLDSSNSYIDRKWICSRYNIYLTEYMERKRTLDY